MTASYGHDLPSISIVTPTYNQADYIGDAMASVLDQGYPDLEYVVVDNESTDGTTEVIRAYEDRIARWISEPDDGQYDALNKGFATTSGEIMGWLNSDDMYTPWALHVVGQLFAALPDVRWISTLFPLHWDAAGYPMSCEHIHGFSRRGFYAGENLPTGNWYAIGWIQQESTFWRRSLWEQAGSMIDTTFSLAADFDLWARFFKHADLHGVETPLGGFRHHPGQRTNIAFSAYVAEAEKALALQGGRVRGRLPTQLVRIAHHLPPSLRRRIGLATPVCVRNNAAGWTVVTR